MNIKLIAADMDGIFLSDTKTYNQPYSLAQYQRMHEQGIRFVVVSGNRYHQSIFLFPKIARQVTFVVGDDGWVMSGNEDALNYQLPPHHFNTVVDHLQTLLNIEIIACGKRSVYTLNRYNDALKVVAVRYYHRPELVDDFNHLGDAIPKFGLNASDSLVLEIQLKLHAVLGDMVTVVATGYSSINLVMSGVYKANGLYILQQRWSIEDHEVIVFGNGGNDIEMLQHIGLGSAMANARGDVKAIASRHAPHDNEEGVPWIIGKVLNREAPFT